MDTEKGDLRFVAKSALVLFFLVYDDRLFDDAFRCSTFGGVHVAPHHALHVLDDARHTFLVLALPAVVGNTKVGRDHLVEVVDAPVLDGLQILLGTTYDRDSIYSRGVLHVAEGTNHESQLHVVALFHCRGVPFLNDVQSCRLHCTPLPQVRPWNGKQRSLLDSCR